MRLPDALLPAALGEDAQRPSTHDLGHEILPAMLGRYQVAALPCVEGIGEAPAHWRGGDTIDTHWEAHMELVSPQADFPLSQVRGPLRAKPDPEPAVTGRWSRPGLVSALNRQRAAS